MTALVVDLTGGGPSLAVDLSTIHGAAVVPQPPPPVPVQQPTAPAALAVSLGPASRGIAVTLGGAVGAVVGNDPVAGSGSGTGSSPAGSVGGQPALYPIVNVASFTAFHGLSYPPRSLLLDPRGAEVETDTVYAPGQLTLVFPLPFTGTLYLG